MKLELSEHVVQQIVEALHERPFKIAAPILQELQQAINLGNVQQRRDQLVRPPAPGNGSEHVGEGSS